MKTKLTILAIFFFSVVSSQNQSTGAVNTTITPASTEVTGTNTERFRFGSGLITQLDTGTDFDFTSSSQWLSYGKLSTPGQTLYGYRAQRAGRGLIFGFTGPVQTTSPTTGTPVIEWVGNGTATAGDLLFRTSPSSTSAISTQVMKMRANGTTVFGNTSVYEDGDYTTNYLPQFFTSVTNPKIEINYNDNSFGSGLSVFRKGVYASAFPQKVFGATFFNQNLNTIATNTQIVGIIAQGVNTNGGAYGIDATARTTSNNSNTEAIGIRSTADNAKNLIGVRGSCFPGSLNIINQSLTGISGIVNSSASTLSASSYGVIGQCIGSNVNGSINYGVFGSASGFNNFAGYFNGRIFSTNALVVSDKSLKEDVKLEENVIEKLKQLKPVSYKFISDNRKTGLNLSDRLQHGFIAQELEEVFPELVEEILNPIFNEKNEQIGTKSLKAVNYIGLISVLTSSINEMSEKIATLEEKLEKNEKTFVVNSTKNFSENEISNLEANSYVMKQNVPNPFRNKTSISYSLPKDENNASILILNLNGQIIKEYKLTEQEGVLVIENTTLENGLYLYSLISNGEEIITKKMLVN